MTTETRTAGGPANPGGDPLAYFTSSDDVRGVIGANTFHTFGFTIPTGATINSVTVSVEGRIGNGQGGEFYVGLTKNGATLAGSEIENHSFGVKDDAVVNFGPSLFGASWTAEEINASTFGVLARSFDPGGEFGSGYEIDYIEVTVDYTATAIEQFSKRIFKAARRLFAQLSRPRAYAFQAMRRDAGSRVFAAVRRPFQIQTQRRNFTFSTGKR